MFARRIVLNFRIVMRYTPVKSRSLSSQANLLTKRHEGLSPRVKKEIWQSGQQQRSYRRPGFNYKRYEAAQGVLQRWAAHPNFYYHVGGISAGFAGVYVYNLETVEVSGRRRFNIVSPALEKKMAEASYQQTLQEFGPKIMSHWSREHRQVQRVLQRLLPHSGLEAEDWQIHVIDDDLKNAFVIPGGKVFVFRGILDICDGDDGLAAVLGHEIAHNVAHHAAERMSLSAPLVLLAVVAETFAQGIGFQVTSAVTNLLFQLPGSRKQEEEADYIGLLMMSESCYRPEAAIGLWQRMEMEEKKMGGAPPQFMSTHPSSHNRLEKIQGWLPQARQKLENGECGTTQMYAQNFGNSVQGLARWR